MEFIFDVLELAAGGSTKFTHAGVVTTVRAAHGGRADRVAELVAVRRADTARLATVQRRRTAGAVVAPESDTRISAVAWKDVTRSRDIEQSNSGDNDDNYDEI